MAPVCVHGFLGKNGGPRSPAPPTLSSRLASSPRPLRTFSTRARRPERDSSRLTTLSKSPMNILYLSNSLGLQSSRIRASTSSPKALLSLMSISRLPFASRRVSSLWVRLPMSSACDDRGDTQRSLVSGIASAGRTDLSLPHLVFRAQVKVP